MGRELGRISGPLLSDNLLRNGRNLVFDTDLLYLNVNNGRIGINNISPSREFHVRTEINTTNLIVDTLSEVANFTISTNQIQDSLSTITISPAQSSPVINATGVATALLTFSDRTLINNTANSNIEFTPSGSGVVNIRNNTLVNGNVRATGNITWDGDIQLGNESTDTINFASDIDSNIVPNINDTYDLGKASGPALIWNTLYTKISNTDTINANLASVTTGFIGNLSFESNNIRNITSTSNINLLANTTQQVKFNDRSYVTDNNSILTNGAFTIYSTGNGYVKVTGSNGLVIPSGATVGPEGAATGMMRFNTDLGYVRVFNGTNWQPVGGISSTLTQEEVTDVMWAWDLILG